ncbi:unnamed protein product [Mytilus coruscus]|uniref:Protein-tyrosine-phosphatase n=1 Tax=Mytilus coruscus TaxID=42192 RepID=A0A6J8B036_MYTCO|nr:unnamed protein product [Mytilus coruscus]
MQNISISENLTPFGRATQSSQSGEGGPRNAILPPISNEWGYDKCTHTDPYKSPAWWMFNISFGPAFITDIKIYYREQCCQKNFWGKDCEHACTENCIGQQCYPGNGFCVWGCNAEHCLNDICDKTLQFAPMVARKDELDVFVTCVNNIATDASVSQNPSGSQPANLANDGDKTSCSKTQGTNVRFHVDMKEIRIVTEIYLTVKVNSTMEGVHTIYASNSSVFPDKAIVLYQGESLPTAIGVHAVFRYLTYVPAFNNAVLGMEICEIGIVGCQSTQYGLHCNKTCPSKCRGPCDLETGFCIFGCLGGWVGQKCEQACSFGYYGSGCNEQCSVTCMNPRCSHINGECINGCKSGWKGFNCTQECSNGYFGENCTEFCGGCLSNSCDPLDGLCKITTACRSGYVDGDYCNQRCSNGYFGGNCTDYCWGCLSNLCDPFDGLCKSQQPAAVDMFTGITATKCNVLFLECSSGNFGENCTDYCWGCLSNLCDPLDGLCNITTACSPGYTDGEYCNKTCNYGFYGNGCIKKCSRNCHMPHCNHITGECVGGCKNGWMGFNCTEECKNGYFGTNCEDFCRGCLLNICDPVDGFCRNTTACNPGYKYGEHCNELCDDWYFGNNCSSRCNCLIKPCAKDAGECSIGGCKAEWRGESCNQVRAKKVINWLAIGGGVAGLIIIVLILLAVCFTYKRKAISTEDRNQATNTEYDLAIRDQEEVPYSLADREETEQPPAREHAVHSYNNIPIVDTSCNYKIPIENLKQVFNEKQKDCGFKNEFENLPKENGYPCVEGSREENKVKNRFLTTLPYDHSRIVLKGNTNHDYINASYIDEKCAQYWPDSVDKPLLVDIYSLIMTEEKQHTHYMCRKITMSISSSMDVRNVCQFQFTQWPDHGVPDSIKLVNFYRRVSEDCNRNGPMIVHCSAGVGRTGTFIAIDALYENGKKVGYVDVMDYLHMMRKDRMNMIKTYVDDEFRPYLISYGRTRTDYINAVIIPGYRDDSIFLVTQCPIKDTIVDFWTMIYDHNSRIIVLLDPILESAQLWLERKEMMEFHDLSIIMEEESHLEELKIAMNHKTKQDKRVINVFTASEWQGAILPSSQTMLGLLKSVGNCRDSQKCPITVVCRNGCTKSWLFVALSLILDKLELDDEIDVFQAVRHIQTRRPEFLTNCDHYQYCYKCIKDLLKGQSVYTNTYI